LASIMGHLELASSLIVRACLRRVNGVAKLP
jgi:hypothetical protein